MTAISKYLLNGEVFDGMIPVTDSSVLRGDGCFEVIWAYGGQPFRLQGHLDRLQRSADALGIGLPPLADIGKWVDEVAAEFDECAVRIVVTRGPSIPGADGGPMVIVFSHTWPGVEDTTTLCRVVAPWHGGGVEWDLSGAKVLSYAPNLSATRRAQTSGFDDALLVTTEDIVLEGPTFAVAWVIDGVLETPGLELGILDSITRQVVLDEARSLGFHVVEGTWDYPRIAEATEMFAMSTTREVQPVVAVDSNTLEPGPVTHALADAFDRLTG